MTSNPNVPQDPESVWLRDVYKPHEPNLTARAIVGGMLIGCVMCLSNLYVFFKTGWSLGVTLTACILAFAAFQLLQTTGLTKRPLGMLENNALTTVASGAGYMTGGGNMAAFGALLMVPGMVAPNTTAMIAWFGLIAALGVFAAIPIKRQLVNKEALAFPTGTATATTIRSIHDAASGAGTSQAKALALAGLFAALLTALRDAAKLLPGKLELPGSILGHSTTQWTLYIKTEVVLFGAGALMSFRTGWSLLLGAIGTYAVLGPLLFNAGLVTKVEYAEIVKWTLWPGAAMLVGAGLTSFALDYKSLARTFSGLGSMFDRTRRNSETGIDAVEAPTWWFVAGFVVLSPFIVLLMMTLFDIPLWAGIIAIPLAVLMGFVAARVTGETDVTPTKALGPVTQMIYGGLTPGNLPGNIMSGNVTGGVGLHAADLLTTLKTSWLLGAKSRHQVYAQLFGVVTGAILIVPAFNVIIPDPSKLGKEDWPAPSCTVWSKVSELFANGLDALDQPKLIAIAIGGGLGILLSVLERHGPKAIRPFLPSPSGIGISMVVPAANSIAMFAGATTGELIRRRNPTIGRDYVVPVASGLIAGESLMGIAIAMLVSFGLL